MVLPVVGSADPRRGAGRDDETPEGSGEIREENRTACDNQGGWDSCSVVGYIISYL